MKKLLFEKMRLDDFTRVEDDDPTRFDEEIDGKTVRLNYTGAGHIMGTCRMGNDPKTSVVDKFQRSHDHKIFLWSAAARSPPVRPPTRR